MCERWLGCFQVFLDDMGVRPGPGYSLDRKDNSLGYGPDNCRWATAKEQSDNRPSWVHMMSLDGLEMTLSDWARSAGIAPATLRYRLASGWPLRAALTASKGSRRDQFEAC